MSANKEVSYVGLYVQLHGLSGMTAEEVRSQVAVILNVALTPGFADDIEVALEEFVAVGSDHAS